MEEKVIIVDEMLLLYQSEDAFNILLVARWENQIVSFRQFDVVLNSGFDLIYFTTEAEEKQKNFIQYFTLHLPLEREIL